MKIFNVNHIADDGKITKTDTMFINNLSATENALTLIMMLHNISNILDDRLRDKYRSEVRTPDNKIISRDRAYFTFNDEVYCVYESK